MSVYRLYDCTGSGSTIVRAMLVQAGVAFEPETIDLWAADGERQRERLRAINPLAELPALRLPDGRVISESVAIALHLADIAPQAGLAPPLDHQDRVWFLRWLVFLGAAIYPTFTYGDYPARYVAAAMAGEQLRASTDARRQELWRVMDKAADATGPWFLTSTGPTAIDIFLAVMTQWRPRPAWFADHTPRLYRCALAVAAQPHLAPVVTGLV